MKGQKGFTLIELMIVVAVIGVLSAIAVPQYQNYIKKSELGAALATVAALKVNVEDYIATNAQFPKTTIAEAKSLLGAPTTDIGDITTKQGSVSAAGNIIMAIKSGQNNGSKIAMERDATGNWKCRTNVASSASATYPKNCTHIATL